MDKAKIKTEKRIVAVLLLWGGIVAAASFTGLLQVIPRQFGAALAVVGIIVPVLVYFKSRSLYSFINGIGIKALTTFHVWRIGAGALFLVYGSQGLLPDVFAVNAGYGDIVIGLLAAILLLLPELRIKYWVFHLLGMADFVVAISTGLTLVLTGNGLMNNLFQLPVVLIPLFGVGISGAMHIFAFDRLWRKAREIERTPAAA